MKPLESKQRAVWLKRMHEWHWISSAIALLGLLFFALTGFTLNHAELFEAPKQQYDVRRADVPAELVTALRADIEEYGEGEAEPTEPLRKWIRDTWSLETRDRIADWKADEILMPLERPGGDAWLKVDLARAVAEYHVSNSGWIAYFNDLHKGRHTGTVWAWFIDLVVVACVIFSITGFVILKMHAVKRRMTWPLVGFGILLPVLLAALFIH
ncbi:MAG: PepSY-associated TM helix domain-containing protein [Steroidobacteraceae bacterium]